MPGDIVLDSDGGSWEGPCFRSNRQIQRLILRAATLSWFDIIGGILFLVALTSSFVLGLGALLANVLAMQLTLSHLFLLLHGVEDKAVHESLQGALEVDSISHHTLVGPAQVGEAGRTVPCRGWSLRTL